MIYLIDQKAIQSPIQSLKKCKKTGQPALVNPKGWERAVARLLLNNQLHIGVLQAWTTNFRQSFIHRILLINRVD